MFVASLDDDTRKLVYEVSMNTQAIGRRINSPKNAKEDFVILAEALETNAKTLHTISQLS